MKRLMGLIPVLACVLAIVLAAGCTEDEERMPAPAVGSVDVALGEDTLQLTSYIFPDTVTTSVTVTVHNTQNAPMAGAIVRVSLSSTWCDTLLYANPARGDTTDENGRIEYVYLARGVQDTWIRASAGGASDSAHVVVLPYNEGPIGVDVWTDSDTLWLLPQEEDSLRLHVRLQYDWGWASPPDTVFLSVSRGYVTPYIVIDDPYEQVEGWWRLTGNYGTFRLLAYVSAEHFVLPDTAWVTVRPPPVGQVHIFATDTLWLAPGDTISIPVQIVVTSQAGAALPGRRIQVGLENPALGFLEYTDFTLQDTTNEFGRVNLLYTTMQVGVQTIIALCEGVQAPPHQIVTLYGAWSIALENTPVLYVPNDTVDVHLYDPNGDLAIGELLTFRAEFDSNQVTHNAQTTSSSWGCNPPLLYWGDGNDDPDNPIETIHAYFVVSAETLAHTSRTYAVRPR